MSTPSTPSTTLAARATPKPRFATVAVVPVVALLAALVFPRFADPHLIEIGIVLLMFALLGMAWDIIGGWAGQMSFGHAAFFGIGAYTSSLLWVNLGITPWIGMIAGALVAALFGVLVAIATFRAGLRGHYFALAMFAVAQMMMALFVNLKQVGSVRIGGAEGLQLPYKGSDPAFMIFETRAPFFYLLLAMCVGVLVFVKFMSKRPIGVYLQAIRNDEEAAEAMGIDVFGCKVAAMAASAFFTGAAGAVYAQIYLYIEPGIVFSAAYSIQGLLCAVIGGSGTLWGPLLGALVLTPLAEVSKVFFRNQSGLDLVLYGALLIVCVRFIPQGLVGLIADLRRKRKA